MTPDIDQLLEDIKKARQQPGMNASWQDVLKRAHRAITDLREMSAICESGCDRALEMLEINSGMPSLGARDRTSEGWTGRVLRTRSRDQLKKPLVL